MGRRIRVSAGRLLLILFVSYALLMVLCWIAMEATQHQRKERHWGVSDTAAAQLSKLPGGLEGFFTARHSFRLMEADAQGKRDSLVHVGCDHTVQGPFLVADDLGRVCRIDELGLYNGCCPPSEEYLCQSCAMVALEVSAALQSNVTRPDEAAEHWSTCCTAYELCISCCLDPRHTDRVADSAGQSLDIAAAHENKSSIFSKTTTAFEVCSAMCRFSSASLVEDKYFQHPHLRYCFG